MAEIPTKPYILRALYEWCVDNGYTPHLAVKVDERSLVPTEYVKVGEITLNISPTAVHKLQMSHDLVEVSARFSAAARPPGAAPSARPTPVGPTGPAKPAGGKPKLRRVK